MLGKKKIFVFCALLVICTIRETEAVVGLGLVYALTPGAAVGGLVTGIIGVILGGVSIAVALDKLDLTGDDDDKKKKKKKEDEMKMMMMMNMSQPPMMMHQQQQPKQEQQQYQQQPQQQQYRRHYDQGRRYKREATEDVHKRITEEKVQLESYLDKVYVKDTSQCLEKLICSISRRMNFISLISPEEKDIINVIQHNILHGYMYKKMLVSQKVGKAGGDCNFLYSSCPIPASQMLYYIRESSKRIEHSMR